MNTMKSIYCDECNGLFEIRLANYKQRLKRQSRFFCSTECMYKSRRTTRLYACANEACKKEFSSSSDRKYCSQSCANTVNNSIRIRNAKYQSVECKYCGGSVGRPGVKICDGCRPLKKIENLSLKDLKSRCRSLSDYHSRIRANSREAIDAKECFVCGYTVYLEVCHIKSVSEFNESTLIKEVNRPENLVALCPNHHKELDMGLLERSRVSLTGT